MREYRHRDFTENNRRRERTDPLKTIKPNTCSLGYALFLAINAAGVWGGVFPFLPLDMQTPGIMARFFVAQSLVFGLSYLASALGSYFFPGPTRRFLVFAAGTPYFLGWACLIGAMYIDALAAALMTAGGALLGLGSAGFYMLWQRLFAGRDAESGTYDLVVGTAYSAPIYFALYLIPRAVTALLIPLVFLPLFGLCIVICSRKIDLAQPMFEDVPRQHPAVYRRVLQDYWRSALCIGALGFGSGIMRSLAIDEPEIGILVNVMSMAGAFCAAIALLAAWRRKNLRINVVTVYRALFPFVITAFVLLTFLGEGFLALFAGTMYAFYSCGTMLMVAQCAQASRDRGVNPIFIYGFFGGVVYILHDLGFIGDMLAESLTPSALSPLASAGILGMYLLALMYFVGQGGFRQMASAKPLPEKIEFISLSSLHGAPEASCAAQGPDPEKARPGEDEEGGGEEASSGPALAREDAIGASKAAGAPMEDGFLTKTQAQQDEGERKEKRRGDEPQYRDRVSKQCAALQQHYHLTTREAEVMELLARGNSVAFIADELVVSENTIRTHSRRIYAKLAVHKKQELIALVNSFAPESDR